MTTGSPTVPDASVGGHDPLASLVSRGLNLRFEDLPGEAVELAQQCILDTLGTAVAGMDFDAPRIVRETALASRPTGAASVWGSEVLTDAATAALVNGTAAHVLDFDDWAPGSRAHQSVVLVPAVLAAAEESALSGRDVITAMVAGYETAERLGAALGVSQYQRGFHTTGTMGAFSAAMAASHLAQLSEQQALAAFNLAATQAAGLKALFGTMAKSYHAGRAAQAGINSARLAAAGFQADKDAVFGHQGYAEAHSDAANTSVLEADLRGRFYLYDNVFKHHASCLGTHAAVDSSLAAQREHGIRIEDVSTLHITVAEELTGICAVPWPVSGLDGKFSVAFTTALAWVFGRADADLFTNDTISDPAVASMRGRITVGTVPGRNPLTTTLDVTLTNGSTLTVKKTVGRRSWDRHPVEQRASLIAKFKALTVPALGLKRAEEIIGVVFALQDLGSIEHLTRLLRSGLPAKGR